MGEASKATRGGRTVKENQKKKHGPMKESTQLSSVVRITNGEKISAAAEVRTAYGEEIKVRVGVGAEGGLRISGACGATLQPPTG